LQALEKKIQQQQQQQPQQQRRRNLDVYDGSMWEDGEEVGEDGGGIF